jgi:DNA helicase-2/ATP-dependent DNA helicase PcrA
MNLNSRNDLEEERRLFYVALTRAEKKVFLSYVLSRYRWGKLIDSEQSRFINEINEEFIQRNIIQKTINKTYSDRPSFNKVGVRYNKVQSKPPKNFVRIKKTPSNSNLFNNKLNVGNIVLHERFGRGKVLAIEGRAENQKAEIQFERVGSKKLLLRFSKLKVIA